MSQYFPLTLKLKLFSLIKQQKQNLKNATIIDTSKLAAKSGLASFKVEIHKLDIDKFVPVPVDLSKLSNVVKMILLKNLCRIN